ncbi:hypothetical protein C7S18_18245 [Ahniella affigens]|uniref:DUF4340 domain-containing protein n=1 Tax=Ahniella affigens TaxID=2021234 RepID=A0A2P1PVX1_9GAMM|nr:DUF4340 domain-containing protein [Ahniella affigens]AVP98996.1 hypothetical protein C7S18_18245 [Ahniella affigens]
MSKHQFNKLLIVTVVVLVAAFWATSTRSPESREELAGQSLVADLKQDINKVSALRFVEAGDKTVLTIVKGDKTWTLAERDHYPVDMQKVREYLLKLAEADLLEAKTSRKESYAKLGVEDVAAAEAKSVRVELDGLAKPVKIVVGNANSMGQDGTYVRRNDEEQSWLAKGSLIPDRVVGNWLDKNVIDIQSSRIERFLLAKSGSLISGSKSKPDDDKYVIENVPKGRELNSEYEGNTLGAALASLTMDDVRKSGAAEIDPSTSTAAKYQAFDGLVIEATAWQEGDKGYVRLSASLDEAKAGAHIDAEQAKAKATFDAANAEHIAKLAEFNKKKETDKALTDADAPVAPTMPAAVSDAAKDKADQLATLKQEVETINQKCAGWDFQLPTYKFSSINKTMDELLKPKA